MRNILPFLLLLAAARLGAQGICDSTISIAPIQPVCEGWGERYLQVSHPGGVFNGPGLVNNSPYLNSEFLSAGFYTVTYTITGPGGCTAQATQQYQVRSAQEAFASVIGDIDCSNPNSTVFINGFLPNQQNYFAGQWHGPDFSNKTIYGISGSTDYAGTYRFYASPVNSNDCPAYGWVNVDFINPTNPIKIVSCTNCNDTWPTLKIKIDSIPLGWQGRFKAPNSNGYSNAQPCTAVYQSGNWLAEIENLDNGCKSVASKNLDAENALPSVSSGSDLQLWCGGTGHFVAATSPLTSSSDIRLFWTLPNGNTVPTGWAIPVDVKDPGMYVLHGLNLFTGCEDRDTSIAYAAVNPVSTQIMVLCDGENFNGHTTAGTYIDSIPLPNGCIKTQITKVLVLAPLLNNVSVTADNGNMSGSIDFVVTQGWAPFSYSWSTGDFSASINNLSAGTYTVTVTDANDCQHVREVEVPSGKPNAQPGTGRVKTMLLKTRLYPNPAVAGVTEFTLDINSTEAGVATLLVNDVLGRSIATQEIQIQKGKTVISWPESLEQGMYTLLLKGDFGLQPVSKLLVTGK